MTVLGQPSSLSGKIICIDAGHGGTASTDSYRVGPTGEREEWVNLRVALLLQKMLEGKGAKVVMTRTDDTFIPLLQRSDIAKENQVNVFVSIHHNATADSSVNFPIIYYHGNASENNASVKLGKKLGEAIRNSLFTPEAHVSLVSDFTVFAESGASVLRNTYGMPAVLVEASFFTNPAEEQRLKDYHYNTREAQAFLLGLELFFDDYDNIISPRHTIVPQIPPFKVFQEAERMKPEAKLWKENYQSGVRLMEKGDKASFEKAFDMFTLSARAFPDSYLAGECHLKRAILLEKLGKVEESKQEMIRYKEYYVRVE